MTVSYKTENSPIQIKYGVNETITFLDFPGGPVVKNPPANAGDTGSIPNPGGSYVPKSN